MAIITDKGSEPRHYFSNFIDKIRQGYRNMMYGKVTADGEKTPEETETPVPEDQPAENQGIEKPPLEDRLKDAPAVAKPKKGWKKYLLIPLALGVVGAALWYKTTVKDAVYGPSTNDTLTEQTTAADSAEKNDSSLYIFPPLPSDSDSITKPVVPEPIIPKPGDTIQDTTGSYKPIKPLPSDSDSITKPVVPEPIKSPETSGPDTSNVKPNVPGTVTTPISQDSTGCSAYTPLKLPKTPKIKSLEGKVPIGYVCLEDEHSKWRTYKNFYGLTDDKEIAAIINYNVQVNKDNHVDDLVKETVETDNRSYDADGNLQTTSDGIKGDVSHKGQKYIAVIFGDAPQSGTSSTGTSSTTSNTSGTTGSTADSTLIINSNPASIDSVVDGTADASESGFSRRAYLAMIPIAVGLGAAGIAAGKRRELHPYDAAAEEVSEMYNENFTNGNSAVKKVMKEYELTNDEALNVLSGARETENLNYSKALLKTLNKEELAEVVNAYITSENNDGAMERIMAMTGVKLHSTGSMYSMLDYATSNLGMDKVRKTKLDDFQKDMLTEQLNKYIEQPLEIRAADKEYNLAA